MYAVGQVGVPYPGVFLPCRPDLLPSSRHPLHPGVHQVSGRGGEWSHFGVPCCRGSCQSWFHPHPSPDVQLRWDGEQSGYEERVWMGGSPDPPLTMCFSVYCPAGCKDIHGDIWGNPSQGYRDVSVGTMVHLLGMVPTARVATACHPQQPRGDECGLRVPHGVLRPAVGGCPYSPLPADIGAVQGSCACWGDCG